MLSFVYLYLLFSFLLLFRLKLIFIDLFLFHTCRYTIVKQTHWWSCIVIALRSNWLITISYNDLCLIRLIVFRKRYFDTLQCRHGRRQDCFKGKWVGYRKHLFGLTITNSTATFVWVSEYYLSFMLTTHITVVIVLKRLCKQIFVFIVSRRYSSIYITFYTWQRSHWNSFALAKSWVECSIVHTITCDSFANSHFSLFLYYTIKNNIFYEKIILKQLLYFTHKKGRFAWTIDDIVK